MVCIAVLQSFRTISAAVAGVEKLCRSILWSIVTYSDVQKIEQLFTYGSYSSTRRVDRLRVAKCLPYVAIDLQIKISTPDDRR
jgi:hypothetical protein